MVWEWSKKQKACITSLRFYIIDSKLVHDRINFSSNCENHFEAKDLKVKEWKSKVSVR